MGDNDNLAAMVATVANADALIICSDVAGLYTADPNRDPNATLIPVVERISPEIYALAGGAASKVGTGGMRTKIEAAEKAYQEYLEGRDPGKSLVKLKAELGCGVTSS